MFEVSALGLVESQKKKLKGISLLEFHELKRMKEKRKMERKTKKKMKRTKQGDFSVFFDPF